MKAKKDGKLNTSPDPYGVEEIGVTKLGNIPELGEFPYYMNGTAVGNMGPVPHNLQQNCMLPTYAVVPQK